MVEGTPDTSIDARFSSDGAAPTPWRQLIGA